MTLDLQPIIAKLQADTKDFDNKFKVTVQVMERFNKKGEVVGAVVRKTAQEMDKAKDKTDGFRLAMTRLSRDIKVAGTNFNFFAGAAKGAYEAASEGAKIMAAEQFFKNAGKSIAEYREATKGMVSDAELMKKANLADSMGIDEKTFKQLVMVAEASALKTGQSFDHMFNSIITGTARSSRLLLDNLGIIVSVGEANENYAKKVGIAADALSNEQKQLAFVEEVAKKSAGTLIEYGEVTDKTAESFARFDATLQNIADSIKTGLASALSEALPLLTSQIQEIEDVMRRHDWGALGEYVGLSLLQGLFTTLDLFDPGDFFGKLATDTGKSAKWALEKSKLASQDAQTQTEDLLNALLRQARPFQPGMAMADREDRLQYFANFTKMQIDQLRQADPAWADLIEKIRQTARELGVLPKAIVATTGGGSPAKKTGRGGRGVGETRDYALTEEDKAMYGIFKGDSLIKAILADTKRLNDEYAKNAQIASDEWADSLKKAAESLYEWDKQLRMTQDAVREQEIDAQAAKLAQRREQIMAGISSVSGSVASGTGLFGPLASAFAPVLTAMGPLGAALAAILPVIGSLIDGLASIQALLGGFSGGLALLVKNGLSQFLEIIGKLGPPLSALLASIGVLLGSALRPFILMLDIAVTIVAAVINAFSFAITVLSPFVEMLVNLFAVLFTGGLNIVQLFFSMETILNTFTVAITTMTDTMLGAAIWFNNGLVNLIRSWGLKGFGQILNMDDFITSADESTEDNTDAIKENTKAVRDLAREFRNLPQGYKAEGAIYSAQDPVRRLPGSIADIGNRAFDPRRRPRPRDRL